MVIYLLVGWKWWVLNFISIKVGRIINYFFKKLIFNNWAFSFNLYNHCCYLVFMHLRNFNTVWPEGWVANIYDNLKFICSFGVEHIHDSLVRICLVRPRMMMTPPHPQPLGPLHPPLRTSLHFTQFLQTLLSFPVRFSLRTYPNFQTLSRF
jgi:hypothetical protein